MPKSLYSSEFITCLLENNWDALQKTIIIKLFIPYLLYAICSTFYMKLALAVDSTSDEAQDADFSWGLASLCLISLLLWLW